MAEERESNLFRERVGKCPRCGEEAGREQPGGCSHWLRRVWHPGCMPPRLPDAGADIGAGEAIVRADEEKRLESLTPEQLRAELLDRDVDPSPQSRTGGTG